jgi:glucose-6-phosphate isomerase
MQSPLFSPLSEHYQQIRNIHLREFFSIGNNRFKQFSLCFESMVIDYSKHRIIGDTMKLLTEFAVSSGLSEAIDSLFLGHKINTTENRSVLHTALRNRSNIPVIVNGIDVMPEVNAVLEKIRIFTHRVRSGEHRGFTGEQITDIVNIGIGGSDLGPKMVTHALTPYSNRDLHIHFVSNIDATHLVETLRTLRPESTLFIIASKTFTTDETMTNAHSARSWFLSSGAIEADIALHFVAVSTNFPATTNFGINPDNVFIFWDWVGGRFSLWSAIGLPIALSVGFENFIELLEGAEAMDVHFRHTEFEKNIPVILALLDSWYINFFGTESHAILPYSEYLRMLPAYLQQAEMESNGKFVRKNGERVDWNTASVIWGQPGTDSQHSFFQLLHQGTRLIPCDFIAAARSHTPLATHQEKLMANFFAQTEALMQGKTAEEARQELEKAGLTEDAIAQLLPHKVFEGNRPSTTILLEELTPRSLGSLIALYEHKIFVQGILWNINSFDQWGVELGKQLAKKILPELISDEKVTSHDDSTNGLIAVWKSMK